MNNRKKEIAKFACGFEAFHALAHAVLWLSGTTVTVLGFAMNPNWHVVSLIVNGVITVLLGIYAWRPATHQRHTGANKGEI